jgi:hypothetical protein
MTPCGTLVPMDCLKRRQRRSLLGWHLSARIAQNCGTAEEEATYANLGNFLNY